MYAGARIRRQRERLGLTQEQLAFKVGHSTVRALQRIEAGLTDMSITSMVRISEVLKIPPSSLLRPTKPLARRAGRPRKRATKPTTPPPSGR